MCWENCQRLQANFQARGHICSQKTTCFPGCMTACQFMNTDRDTQKAPIRPGEEVLKIEGGESRWPEPESKLDGPWVYLVMRRLNNAWRQITQTVDLSARIPYGSTNMVRVLVVGRDGLFTVYSPSTELPSARETANNVIQSLGQDALLRLGLPTPEPDIRLLSSNKETWNLHEVSVEHQEVIVVAEIAWDPRHTPALYLVTWEVDGGGIQGNLFTDSTSVALSLWPGTLFNVQVELVGGPKSEGLTIDTRKTQTPTMLKRRTPMDYELTFGAGVALIFCVLLLIWRMKHNQKFVLHDSPDGLPPILTVLEIPPYCKIKTDSTFSSPMLRRNGEIVT